MIDPATNIVWRIDGWAQQLARDSTAQASSALHAIADGANWWGGTGVVLLAAALWLGARVLNKTSLARVGLRGAEGLAVASAVSGIIKGLAGRARPFVTPGEPWHWEFNRGWSDAQYFSMPSGHTTATVAFVVGVLVATRGIAAKSRAAFVLPLIVSAAAVAFARVYTNQHWASDIVAALVLGTTTSLLLARVHANSAYPGYHRLMLGAVAPDAKAAKAAK